MAKRHSVYVLVTADGRYVDAFLSYSEANRELHRAPGGRIITVRDREDY